MREHARRLDLGVLAYSESRNILQVVQITH